MPWHSPCTVHACCRCAQLTTHRISQARANEHARAVRTLVFSMSDQPCFCACSIIVAQARLALTEPAVASYTPSYLAPGFICVSAWWHSSAQGRVVA